MFTEVTLETAPCPIGCTGADIPVLNGRDRLHDRPGEFQVVRCSTCGLMRTSPRPTIETIGVYYPPEYAPHHRPPSKPADHTPPRAGWQTKVRRVFHQNSWCIPAVSPGRMLEIGCGSGAFLSLMQQQGWCVSGVEFSSAAATRIRAQGFDVTSGAIEVVEPPNRDFDLVVAWMVVEHLHDPVRALARVRAWCKPRAALVISVPDAGGVGFRIFRDAWYALSLPIHLFHFSEETIRLVLAKAGWEVDRIFWHNNPNTLLHSLRYLCGDRGWRATADFLQQVVDGQRLPRSRMVLGKLLGLLRVSGAMTVWAHATDGP